MTTSTTNRIDFIMAVWGQEYVRYFLEISLPSQLSPNNLTAVSSHTGLLYKIYTTRADVSSIQSHPAYQKLSQLIETQILGVDQIDPSNKFAPLMSFHNRAIEEAYAEKAALVFLSPDFVLADGTILRLLECMKQGYRTVLVLTLRLNREQSIQALCHRFYNPDDLTLTASPREMIESVFPLLHGIERTYYWDSQLSSFPIHAYWPLGNKGILARCFYLHPLLINPRYRGLLPQITIDADYVDLVCPDPSDIYIVQDSDELTCFELTSQNAIDENAAIRPSFAPTIWNYARWASINANPVYKSLLHHWYFQHPIRIHSGDRTDEWKKAEFSSWWVACGVRWLSLFRRWRQGIREMIRFYYATQRCPAKPPEFINRGFKSLFMAKKDKSSDNNTFNIDLTDHFSGTGWGETATDPYGNRWRWMGPDCVATLLLEIDSNANYLLKTIIHTVIGTDLVNFRVQVNSVFPRDQKVLFENGICCHSCMIPKHLLISDRGETEIVYRLEKDESEGFPQIGLKRVICQKC